MADTYKTLVVRCAQCETNLAEICRATGVERKTIDKWKRGEPKTLQILDKLHAELDRRAAAISERKTQ